MFTVAILLATIAFAAVHGTDQPLNEDEAIQHALFDAAQKAEALAAANLHARNTLPRKRQMTFNYFGGDDDVAPVPTPPRVPGRFNYFE